MAVLIESERVLVWAAGQRLWSRLNVSCGVTKAELRAAVNAIDDWCEANQSAFNLAIPQPARSALTTPAKAQLLGLVARVRAGDLPE